MDKNAIIIIDAFLNSTYKIEVFKLTLASIKKLNLPILVVSNHQVPDELIKNFDYFIYSKDNLLFSDSYDKYPSVVFFLENDMIRYENHNRCYQKHGLSVISNLKKSSEFAKNLGYKKFIRIEWDFIIHEDEVVKMQSIIDEFLKNDRKACFIYDPKNASGLPNLAYHFWMVDLNFWNENFPSIHNEKDYKRYLLEKNRENFFEIAERILYMAIFDKLSENEIILENHFYEIFRQSKINHIVNDINFDLPSSNGVCRGLSKIIRNGIETGELALFSWNRLNEEIDIKNYEIYFKEFKKTYTHTTPHYHWVYSIISDFDKNKFPITLKLNNEFEKEYYSLNEINCSLQIKP